MLASIALSCARVHSRPSVYWTDRFLEDTTLTVTVPGRLSTLHLLLCQGPPGSGLGRRWPLSQLWGLATLSDMLPLTSWGWVTPVSHQTSGPPGPGLLETLPAPPSPRVFVPTLTLPLRSQSQLEVDPGHDGGGKPSRGNPGLYHRRSGAGIHRLESPLSPVHVAPDFFESTGSL